MTTLEEIFLKLGEEEESKKESNRTKRLKEKGKQRKSNKRSAKNSSGVDQSTLLDFYLADTDDENYQISASEKESEGASSDEEWT